MARGDDLVLKISADTTEVASGLKPLNAALSTMETEAEQAAAALNDIEDEIRDISRQPVDIDIRTQALDKARADIERLKDQIAEDIIMGIDTRQTQRELSNLQSTVKRVLADIPPVVIDVDAGRAESEVDSLADSIDAIESKRVNLDVAVDQEGLRGVEALREGVRETTTSLTQMGTGLTGVSVLALAAVPALADLNDTLDDMRQRNIDAGRSNSTLLRSASAVTRFIGGPWGLALVAGASLLAAFAANSDDADDATKQFTDSLDAQAGAFDENNRALVAKRLAEKDALQAAELFGISTDELVTRILQQKSATDLLEKSQTFQAARQDLFRDKNTESADSVATLINALEDARGLVATSAVTQARLGRAVGETADEIGRASDGIAQETQTWEDWGKAVGDLTTELDGMIESLDILNERFVNSRQATSDYQQGLADLNVALDENKRTLALSTEEGRENDQLVRDQAENIATLADARLADAAASGESTETIMTDYRKQREGLIRTADQMGMTRAQAERYVDQLLRTPEEVETEAKVLGIDAMTNSLDNATKDRTVQVNAELTVNLDKFEADLRRRTRAALAESGQLDVPGFGGSRSVAPPAPPIFMQPRLFLDSRPIRGALRGDVQAAVSSAVAATRQRGRM